MDGGQAQYWPALLLSAHLIRCYASRVSPPNARLEKPVRIVLAGFMGSGKTTVGRLLADRLGWKFADLDDEVASREGLTVPAIFRERGEAAFRAAEVSALRGLLQANELVISLGGGAPETVAVRELLADTDRLAVIHLHAPFDLLYDRCATQALDRLSIARPLLGTREAAESRYTRRLRLYAEVAHASADAALPPPMVVETIVAALGLNL